MVDGTAIKKGVHLGLIIRVLLTILLLSAFVVVQCTDVEQFDKGTVCVITFTIVITFPGAASCNEYVANDSIFATYFTLVIVFILFIAHVTST